MAEFADFVDLSASLLTDSNFKASGNQCLMLIIPADRPLTAGGPAYAACAVHASL